MYERIKMGREKSLWFMHWLFTFEFCKKIKTESSIVDSILNLVILDNQCRVLLTDRLCFNSSLLHHVCQRFVSFSSDFRYSDSTWQQVIETTMTICCLSFFFQSTSTMLSKYSSRECFSCVSNSISNSNLY